MKFLQKLFAITLFVLVGQMTACLPCHPTSAQAEDWVYWRGPNFNGSSRETGLVDDWDPRGGEGSNVAWVRDDIGGRSTPIVMNGRLYTMTRAEVGTPQEGERVVCLDAASGETLWENRFNVFLSDVPDTRVGWSSVVGDPSTGNVFALGVCGLFLCIDGESGETKWSLPLHERFGALSTYGGRTNFPIVHKDLVIISAVVIGWGDMAKPCHRFIAFNKESGEVVWFRGTRELPYDTTYSSGTLTQFNGQDAFVFGSGDGAVWALQPSTGKELWHFNVSRRGLNVSPLVVGDRVFTSHSEENTNGTTMGTVVAIDGTGSGDISDSGELWRVDELMAGKSSPVAIDGRLFVFDDRAKLHVLDMETGETIGKKIALGTVMRSSPLYADGRIYAVTANGRWYILEPDADRGAKKVKSGRLLKGDESHASPICSGGRIYLQTSGRLYCLGNGKQVASTTAAAPSTPPSTETSAAAQLQLTPAEVLLGSGESQEFKLALYDASGNKVEGDVSGATFTLDGPGVMDGSVFQSPKEATHSATVLTAELNGMKATARMRIVPPLPWKFDFEDVALAKSGLGEPPVSWVGCRYRHHVREVDGSKVMVKVTTIPKGTRSRGWFGQSDLKNYTIQADVRGANSNGKMPDIGLIAQGYTLDMQGISQRLQIRSWVPQLRMATTIDFEWQPDTWYTMKFRAEDQGSKAVLKGKIWPRDEQEPAAWTIEAEDTSPNHSGSPGLFGNAKDSEIYLDNIQVTANNS
jgi:outer membrane protein assembly factor BamB